jgi:hypothetical protein
MLDTVYGNSPVEDQRAAAISIVVRVMVDGDVKRKAPQAQSQTQTRFDRIQNLQISTSSFRLLIYNLFRREQPVL